MKCLCTFYGHKDTVLDVIKDGDTIYSCSKDGTIRVWDLKSQQCKTVIKLDSAPKAIVMHTSYTTLFANTVDGAVYSIEITEKGGYKKEDIISNSVSCIALGGDTLYTGWEDNTIRLIDVETKSSSKILFGHVSVPLKLVCVNGVLFSSSMGEIKIWNASSGEPIDSLKGVNISSSFFLVFSDEFGATLLSISSVTRKYYEKNVNGIVRQTAIDAALKSLENDKNIRLNLENCSMDAFPDIKPQLAEKVQTLNVSKNRLTKLPIALGNFCNVKELFCNQNGICSIPKEIGLLKTLELLHLSENEIINLPEDIGNLDRLIELKLDGNNIKNIPNGFSKLTCLQILDLSHNALAYLPSHLTHMTSLRCLSLCNNEFSFRSNLYQSPKDRRKDYFSIKTSRRASKSRTFSSRLQKEDSTTDFLSKSGQGDDRDITKQSSHLPIHLMTNQLKDNPASNAMIRNRRYSYKPVKKNHFSDSNVQPSHGSTIFKFEFNSFHNLTSVDLSKNSLLSIPQPIMESLSLVSLDLSMNLITTIPETIGNLINLKTLNISHNIIGKLPNAISNLKKLKEIYLNNNKLICLPVSIGSMMSLVTMDASNNLIWTVPVDFGRLLNLKLLNLSRNSFTSFPIEITSLNQLEILKMGYNRIKSLPWETIYMRSLINLDMRKNKLTKIEYVGISKLNYLNLRGNSIQTISDDIFFLKNLKELYMGSNQISEISLHIESLTNITYIDLQKNLITYIPPAVFLLPQLSKLNLKQNPIENISKNIVNGDFTISTIKKMRTHVFGSMKKQDCTQLCFCGPEGSGKTSLLHNLKYGKIKKVKPTKGMRIDEWIMKINISKHGKVKTVKSNLLVKEMSGHPNMKGANRLFFNGHCLYIVTYNFTQSESLPEVEQLVQTILTYVYNPSIIVVATHKDLMTDNSVMKMLKAKFLPQGVKMILKVDNLTGDNIIALNDCINRILINDLNYGYPIPSNFIKVRSQFIKDKSSLQLPFMEISDFYKVCTKYNIRPENHASVLRYLVSIGLVIDLKEVTNGECDVIITDVKWLSDMLFKFLTYKTSDQGYIDHENLEEIWNNSAPIQYSFIALLHKMEICIDSNANAKASRNFYSNKSILPALLSDTESNTIWKKAKITEVVKIYKLDYVPIEFISIFIARSSQTLKHIEIWKYGCVVKKNNTPREESSETKCRLEYVNMQEATIKIITRGSNAYILNQEVSILVDRILSPWHTSDFKSNSYVVCYENKEPKLFPMKKIEYEFNIDQLKDNWEEVISTLLSKN